MKVACPKCSREIDPRGLKAHVRTHEEASHQPISIRKPMTSVPSMEWRDGYINGVLDSRRLAS